MNVEIVSTSQVTRETSAPRRSVLCVSTDRSCTCRKALTRSAASPVSAVRKSRTFIAYADTAVTSTATAAAPTAQRTRARFGAPVAANPLSIVCCTAMGTTIRPAVASEREQQGGAQAVVELRRQLQAAAHGGEGAELARCPGRRPRGRDTPMTLMPAPACRRDRRPRPGRCRRGCPAGRLVVVGVDQAPVGLAAREQLQVRAAVEHAAVLDVDHLVGQRDRRLAVGDHDDAGRGARSRAARPRIAASTRGSTADVASSRTSRRGRRTTARASAMRWRWPPDSEAPRSPTRVSSPSGSAATKPSACASRSAAHTASSSIVGAQRDVAAHGVVEQERLLRHDGRDGRDPAARHLAQVDPVEQDAPLAGSTRRTSRVVSVDLPEPVGPTSATVWPGSTVRVTSCSTSAPGASPLPG